MGAAASAMESRIVREFDLIAGYGGPPMTGGIGVSTSEMRAPQRTHPLPEAEPRTRELALGLSYPGSLERAGAVPVVLAPVALAHIGWLLERLGGLMIPGGPDLHPAAYGEEPHAALGPTEPELDAFEIELVRQADALGMPILGVCRGMQVLNVARGGSLVQDLPDQVGEELQHRQTEGGTTPTHDVEVLAGTLLAEVFGPDAHPVNSFHHQAVKRLGADLRPTAFAPDGVIEAVEAVDREFVVGVQWHAESLAERPDHAGLYGAFVEAARRYEAARRRSAAA